MDSDRSIAVLLPPVVKDGQTNQPTNNPTNPLEDMRGHREITLPIHKYIN